LVGYLYISAFRYATKIKKLKAGISFPCGKEGFLVLGGPLLYTGNRESAGIYNVPVVQKPGYGDKFVIGFALRGSPSPSRRLDRSRRARDTRPWAPNPPQQSREAL
jgi:hypothetical protein